MLCALVVITGLLAGAGPTRGRAVGRTSFADKNAGIRLFLPPRWALQVRSALPGLVATFKHPTGARIALSTRTRQTDETAQRLANRHLGPLRKQGWTVGTPTATQLGPEPALQVEATSPRGKTHLVQIYAVREKLAYVLTVTVPEALRTRLAADLRFVTRTARFAK